MPTISVGKPGYDDLRMLTSLTATTNLFWSQNCTNFFYFNLTGYCSYGPLYLNPNFNEQTYNSGPNSTYLSNVTIGGYTTQATFINMNELCVNGFATTTGGSLCLLESTALVGWNVTGDAWLYNY